MLDGGADVGSIRVRAVDVVRDADWEGSAILRFNVGLQAPRGATWPVEETLTFHDRVNQMAQELDLPLPWHVRIAPARRST